MRDVNRLSFKVLFLVILTFFITKANDLISSGGGGANFFFRETSPLLFLGGYGPVDKQSSFISLVIVASNFDFVNATTSRAKNEEFVLIGCI